MATDKKPNILVMWGDDIGQSNLSCYTKGLMGSIPSLDGASDRLVQIPGSMPRLTAIPDGCAFNPRCPHAFDRCRIERPEPMPAGLSQAACWLVAPSTAEAVR